MREVFRVVTRALARHRRDRRERARARARPTRDFDAEARFGAVVPRRGTAGECISGLVLVRRPEAARVPRVRHALHAGAPARRDHGVVRGRLRRLLPLPRRAAAAAVARWPRDETFALGLPGARAPRPSGPARPRRRRPARWSSCSTRVFRPAFGNPCSTAATTAPRLDLCGPGSPSPPTPTSCSRSSSPAATSARSRSTARSTTSPCAAPGRAYLSAGFILEEGLPIATAARIVALDAARRGAGRRHDRHRRHQGRRPRQGRRGLHQHGRDRSRGRPRGHRAAARPGRRRRDPLRRPRPPRHRGHGGARGARLRDPDRERLRAAGRAGAGAARGRRRRPLPARPDPRRARQRAGRDRRDGRVVASTWSSATSRCARTCARACELLGLDPLYVANEGRFVAFVPPGEAPRALEALRRFAVAEGATVIGQVAAAPAGRVTCRSPIGGTHVVDLLRGGQLPRIC